MSKHENKETKTVETEVKETAVEPKENFFKKGWNKTKKFVSEHKGVVIGAAGSVATIAGLLYLGKDANDGNDFDATEAVESESPMDE